MVPTTVVHVCTVSAGACARLGHEDVQIRRLSFFTTYLHAVKKKSPTKPLSDRSPGQLREAGYSGTVIDNRQSINYAMIYKKKLTQNMSSYQTTMT